MKTTLLCRPRRCLVLLSLLALGHLLSACNNPQNLVKHLEEQISAYSAQPTSAAEQEIYANFARLDSEIARLETRGQNSAARELASQRANLRARFEAAKLASGLLKARQSLENFGETVRQVGEQIGESLREAVQTSPSPAP